MLAIFCRNSLLGVKIIFAPEIRLVLKTLSKHSSLPKETRFAIRALKKNYNSLQDDFMEFFPQLIDYVEKEFGIQLSHRITIPF